MEQVSCACTVLALLSSSDTKPEVRVETCRGEIKAVALHYQVKVEVRLAWVVIPLTRHGNVGRLAVLDASWFGLKVEAKNDFLC